MSGYYHKCQVLTNVEIIMFYYESEIFFFLISEVGGQIQMVWNKPDVEKNTLEGVMTIALLFLSFGHFLLEFSSHLSQVPSVIVGKTASC